MRFEKYILHYHQQAENIIGRIRCYSNILIKNLIFKASGNYMTSKSSEFEDNEFEDDFDDDFDNSEDDD